MASKLQRDPSDGKLLRDPDAGKLLRDADFNACCCDEEDTNAYPLLYCPDGTEETGQAISLTAAGATTYVGKVVRVADPHGEGTICVIVGPLPDPPLNPDDYTFPAYTGPLDDCLACCPAEHYQQAYRCDTSAATGLWLQSADVQAGKILKIGGGTTGVDLACYYFADCEAAVPDGGTLINLLAPEVRGWFDSCGSCACDPDPNKLIITVSQDDIDCCQQENEFAGIRREMTRGSAAGTWTIPIVSGTGSLTTTGPRRKVIRDTPTPFPTDCTTGFQSVDPACCDDPGTVVYDSTEMRISIASGFVTARTGFGIAGIFDVGCVLWSFALPSCTDANEESELVGTGTYGPSGFADCSRDDESCPGVPAATATMVLKWAA